MIKKNFSSITINGKTIQCSGSNIVIANGKVVVDGNPVEENIADNITIEIHGNVEYIQCQGNVTVHGNAVDIDCNGNCTVNGNVSGSIDAGGNIHCGNVEGDADAGGNITCSLICGDADAGGNIHITQS
jgi:hypothetical protein